MISNKCRCFAQLRNGPRNWQRNNGNTLCGTSVRWRDFSVRPKEIYYRWWFCEIIYRIESRRARETRKQYFSPLVVSMRANSFHWYRKCTSDITVFATSQEISDQHRNEFHSSDQSFLLLKFWRWKIENSTRVYTVKTHTPAILLSSAFDRFRFSIRPMK